MNARTLGSGTQTVVLAHGFGGDQSMWDKILPHMAANHRIVLFDWCFSGAVLDPTLYDPIRHSTYDGYAVDLIGLLEEMKVESCVLVGHSMSGIIGCIASIKRPELFTRLVLLGASPRLINSEDYEGGFELSDIENMFTSIESNFEVWSSNFPYLAVDKSDPTSADKFSKCLKRMKPEVTLSLAKTVFLGDYRDILDKVEKPCDIIQTRSDVVVPKSVPEYMQRKIKGKPTVKIIDTEGHFPHLTAHVQLVEVLDNILHVVN
ncbi:alpha/beta-Hydrolases superfamily protein [Striga hermonthica]|uniref:Alpha/beta-Hydrolases superfamily protein n=1 Tax=Striga hermonthica TaxID=68872 RepID=A0A9N7R4S4_STRHE|nr:alpha/beta-Hydrolases superfamily protein [Striga hermonthica]